MESINILISTSSFGVDNPLPLNVLTEKGIGYQLNPFGRKLTSQEVAELLKGKQGIIAGTETLNAEVFNSTPELKVISRCGAGLDNVQLDAAAAKGITVYNTPDVHIQAVAELAFSLILAASKKLLLLDQSVKTGEWKKILGANLRGANIGLIGLGKVAKRLVSFLQPFNVTISAYDPVPDRDFARANNISIKPFDEVVSHSDVISLHLPYSESAKHMIGKKFFDSCKPNLILVNTSRGGLIDEDALYRFLETNPRSFACLDVFEQEPYRGPLSKLSNAILTPHVATFTAQTRVEMELEAVVNILKYFNKSNE